jgi:hypothetical protein
MPLPIETQRFQALKKLARERYGAITEAETRILELAASSDNREPSDSKERPEVRGDFLRWLAMDKDAASQMDALGIRVYNATIPSILDLSYCNFPSTLDFEYCTFTDDVHVYSATISFLMFSNCTMNALVADMVKVAGRMALNATTFKGNVFLMDAQIGGDLYCAGTKLTATGTALFANHARIGGSVFLTAGFSSTGTIEMPGAQIGGDLSCAGAKLTATGTALRANDARISGSVLRTEGFSSTGTIRLLGAQIGGNLDCSGAQLIATGEALVADVAKIDGDITFDDGFASYGEIGLIGAEIGGDLDCGSAERFAVLHCDKMRVEGRMFYTNIAHPELATLALIGANVRAFHDDEKSWPKKGNLALVRFVYEELVLHANATQDEIKNGESGQDLGLNPLTRIAWLNRQPDEELDDPQPWMQLAKIVQASGNTQGAKHIVYELSRRQALKSHWRPLSFIYDQIEEQPLRIGWPIAVLWTAGSLVFWRAQRMGAMTPAGGDAPDGGGSGASPGVPVPFNPVMYALENVLPVVRLGQDGAWTPNPEAAAGSWLPEWKWLDGVRRWTERWKLTRWLVRLNYERLVLLRWMLILVGWALALILASAIGEQFKN